MSHREEERSKPNALTQLGRLLTFGRPQWPALLLGVVLSLVAAAMSMVYPQVFRVLVDSVLPQNRTELVDYAAVGLLASFALYSAASAGRHFLFSWSGEQLVNTLRVKLHASILVQDAAYWDSQKTGGLLSRLSTDTALLRNTVSVDLGMLLRHGLIVLGAGVCLFYTSVQLALLSLLVIPVVTATTRLTGRWVRGVSSAALKAQEEANAVAEETIAGARTVRSFANERTEIARYRRVLEVALGWARRRIVLESASGGIGTITTSASVVVVIWAGSRLVVSGDLSVGQLTQFLLYTMLMSGSLMGLVGVWMQISRSLGAVDRVFELIDRGPAMPTTGGVRPEDVNGALEFERVSFAYPTRPEIGVLHDFSLDIDAGARLAIVGPSGAGKSTIGHLVARLYDPVGGEIRLDGIDLRCLDPSWLRAQLGIVRQDDILFSTSIRDNILYGRASATEEEVEAAATTANAHQFIAALPNGYDTLVGDRGVQLSGGQRQRIAIARAVLRNPRILLLDEATSALDAENEAVVTQALNRLMQGRTTIIIAHRMSTMMSADRIVVVEAGRIVQSGTHSSLVREEDGLYARLIRKQDAPPQQVQSRPAVASRASPGYPVGVGG